MMLFGGKTKRRGTSAGIAFAAIFLTILATESGQAQDIIGGSFDVTPTGNVHPFFRHHFMIQGGVAFNDVKSFMQLDSRTADVGTRINLERDLGLTSSHTSADILARIRLSDRWVVEGEYFKIERKETKHVEREISFGDHTFDVGADVAGKLSIASYRLAVGYSFLKTDRAEVGAALSLYVSDVGASLTGHAHIDGHHVGVSTGRYSAPIPLPAIGLYAHYALTSSWLVSGRVDFMDLDLSTAKWFRNDIKDIGGYVLSFEASTEYRLFDNLGVGIGYRRVDFDLWAKSSGLRGRSGYTFSAPTAFLRIDFSGDGYVQAPFDAVEAGRCWWPPGRGDGRVGISVASIGARAGTHGNPLAKAG
jgi:hypothetical protein